MYIHTSESTTCLTYYNIILPLHHFVLMHYTGTAVAMEKQPGILKDEHKAVVENLRDQIQEDLKKYKSSQ